VLRCRSQDVQGARDRRCAPRAGDPSASAWTPQARPRRSRLSRRGEPPACAGALELLARHAGHAATLAPPAGRGALDVCQAQAPAALRSATSSERWCSGSRARIRAGAIGGYRASSWALGSASFRPPCAGSWAKGASDPPAPGGRSVLARAPAVSGSEHRLRLLHRRDRDFAADLRALLHRAGISAGAPGRRGREPRWCVGHPAGAPRGVVATAARDAGPLFDPRPRRHVHACLRRGLR